MEPLSVGVWACRKAGVSAGDRVLVTGAGPIGQLAMQCALAFGATEVTSPTSTSAGSRWPRAPARRATLDAGEPLDDLEADALIECSGHPGALTAGHQGAAARGRRGARRHGAGRGGHAAAER